MEKFITIEINWQAKKRITVGFLCAKNLEDAYLQMEEGEHNCTTAFVVPANQVNQLIVDLNKMLKKARV